MKKTKPKKLLTVLLTLYLALSIVPITAYAGVTDVIGDNTTKPYSHFYHTKVETTAQVTIKDADGNVIETTEVTKSGDFVEGNVNSDAVQAEIKRIDDEIIAQFSSRGNITIENRNSTFMFDHFESGNIIAPDGDILVGDQDALEKAASGSVNRNIVVHEYQVYQTTYDLIVQTIDGGSQDEATINNVCIENVKFAYRSGDAPQATAEVYNADADKYEIAYECWQEMENGEPVAFWYSDESKYTPSLKKITQFEEGKTYMYSIELREKNGYTFADNCSVTINGNPISATANAVKTVDGLFVMNVETIRPEATKKISVIEINNATLTFKDGDKPVFTGTVPENDQYAFRCEWWSLDENTGIVSTEPEWGGDIYKNKITAFEAGKTYHYGVYVTAYTADISPDAKLKINGREVKYTRIGDESDTQSFWVETDLTMTPAADGHTHKYGTEWKYDETNHWHECECGNKADITAHTFKQIIDKEATATEKGSKHEECTVCGYKKATVDISKIDSHNHDYGTEWKYDSTNHWHECECGNKADITAHTFKQIIDKEATATEKGSKHEECTVCGYKKAAVDIPVTDFGNSSDDQPNKPINTASSESSSADQTNKPINTASPKTGNTDNMILWIVLLIAGGGAFITATAIENDSRLVFLQNSILICVCCYLGCVCHIAFILVNAPVFFYFIRDRKGAKQHCTAFTVCLILIGAESIDIAVVPQLICIFKGCKIENILNCINLINAHSAYCGSHYGTFHQDCIAVIFLVFNRNKVAHCCSETDIHNIICLCFNRGCEVDFIGIVVIILILRSVCIILRTAEHFPTLWINHIKITRLFEHFVVIICKFFKSDCVAHSVYIFTFFANVRIFCYLCLIKSRKFIGRIYYTRNIGILLVRTAEK